MEEERSSFVSFSRIFFRCPFWWLGMFAAGGVWCGLLCGEKVSNEFALLSGITIAVLLCVLFVLLLIRGIETGKKLLMYMCFVLLFGGVWRGMIAMERAGSITAISMGNGWYGLVTEGVQTTGSGVKRAKVVGMDDGTSVWLRWREDETAEIGPGDVLLIRGERKGVKRNGDAQERSIGRWLLSRGIKFVAWGDAVKRLGSMEELDITPTLSQRMSITGARLRVKLWNRLLGCGVQNEELDVIAAMVWGERKGLGAEKGAMYSATGLRHVLALSGLHVSILLGFPLWLWIFLGRNHSLFHWIGFVVLSALLWGYVWLGGSSGSLLRARCMWFVLLFGLAIGGRRAFSINSLGLAVVVMVLWRPLWLFDVGFVLSVSGTLGIILSVRGWRNLGGGILEELRGGWLWSRLWGVVVVSVGAWGMTVGIVGASFNGFSIVGLVAGIAAIPPVWGILVCTPCLLIVDYLDLGFLSSILSCVSELCAVWLNSLAGMAARMPGAWIETDWSWWFGLTISVAVGVSSGVVPFIVGTRRRLAILTFIWGGVLLLGGLNHWVK